MPDTSRAAAPAQPAFKLTMTTAIVVHGSLGPAGGDTLAQLSVPVLRDALENGVTYLRERLANHYDEHGCPPEVGVCDQRRTIIDHVGEYRDQLRKLEVPQ